MNKGIQNVLRWIAVLPGSIAAGIVTTFLLHYILYFTLTKFVTPYPEFPERALTPFVIAITFIRAGCEIAPSSKLKVGVGLFSIWIFLAGGFIMLTLTGSKWFGKDLYLEAKGVAPILGIIGAFVGLYLVWKKDKEREILITKENYENEFEQRKPTNNVSFYDEYGTDIFNFVFVGFFILGLFNTTSRFIIFIILLILYLLQTFFYWKQKQYTTKTMKINLAKNIIMVLALSVGIINSKAGFYVLLLCLAMQTFELIKHFVMAHFITKSDTATQQ